MGIINSSEAFGDTRPFENCPSQTPPLGLSVVWVVGGWSAIVEPGGSRIGVFQRHALGQ